MKAKSEADNISGFQPLKDSKNTIGWGGGVQAIWTFSYVIASLIEYPAYWIIKMNAHKDNFEEMPDQNYFEEEKLYLR